MDEELRKLHLPAGALGRDIEIKVTGRHFQPYHVRGRLGALQVNSELIHSKVRAATAGSRETATEWGVRAAPDAARVGRADPRSTMPTSWRAWRTRWLLWAATATMTSSSRACGITAPCRWCRARRGSFHVVRCRWLRYDPHLDQLFVSDRVPKYNGVATYNHFAKDVRNPVC